MKGSDFLYGGAAKSSKPRRAKSDDAVRTVQPPLVGYRFVLIVALVAVGFSVLGNLRVHLVFNARDHEIETHRLQEITRQRRDRHAVLIARTSQLQRGEVLRGAALSSLGMSEPNPLNMETLVVPADVTERWLVAAEGVTFPEKEVPTP